MAGLLDFLGGAGGGGLLGGSVSQPAAPMGGFFDGLPVRVALGIMAKAGQPNANIFGSVGGGTLLGLNSYDQHQQAAAANDYHRGQLGLGAANLALKLTEPPKVETMFDPTTGRETRGMYDRNRGQFVPLGGVKTDLLSPEAVAQKKDIAQAGASNTTLKVENQMGASLAKNIGDIVQGTRDSAVGALDTLDTVGRIRAALPNANLGPTATFRQGADRLAYQLGVGGATTEERLANTRNVIKGLAELSLNSRKSLKGQGQVSDFEGKLLERAASGQIDDFTQPELEALLNVTDRLARKQYGAHSANLERLRANESYKDLAPFYEVPPLPEPAAPKGGNPYSSMSDQQILENLRKQGYLK